MQISAPLDPERCLAASLMCLLATLAASDKLRKKQIPAQRQESF